jgi:CheY-like chemotaxis protein
MLLVDDNDAFREITAIALGSLGYTVQTCSSPEDAIASARTKAPYALLMTDVIMANMNGIQLAAEVRRSLPDIKVLFCSGYPEAVLERQGLDLGIGEFLLKPIALGELASTLKAVLLPPVATSTA